MSRYRKPKRTNSRSRRGTCECGARLDASEVHESVEDCLRSLRDLTSEVTATMRFLAHFAVPKHAPPSKKVGP